MDKLGLQWTELFDRGALVKSKETTALSVSDVAKLLRVGDKTIYRMVRRGDLPGFKVAGSWRFKSEDIASWIEKQKAAPR